MKKLNRIVLIGILVVLVNIINISYAVGKKSFNTNVTTESNILNPRDEILITLSLSDINMGEYGINTLEGIIEYDDEIFENLKSTDIESKNNWTTTYNDENSLLNGKFLSANLTSGVKENTTIFTVKLKVKENIRKNVETKIIFKDITSNDGIELVTAEDKVVNVEIQSQEENKNLNVETTNTSVNMSNVNKTQVTNKTQYKEKTVIVVIALIVIVGVIAIVLWRRNLYYKRK